MRFCGPRGRVLATGGTDAELKLYDVQRAAIFARGAGHSQPVGGVEITKLQTGALNIFLFFSLSQIMCVARHEEQDSMLATASLDGSVRLWRDAECVAEWRGHEGMAMSCCFSADGSLVFSGGSTGKILIHDIRTLRTVAELCGTGSVIGLAASAGLVASVGGTESAHVFSL